MVESQDSEPSLPSHLPSPPKASQNAGRPGGIGPGPGGPPGASIPPVPPPQNLPPVLPEPPPPVPFGLNHIILILVPQFKVKVQNLPKWMGANVKVSLPVTVFFDKLKLSPPPLEPIPPSPLYGPFFPNGHYVRKRNVVEAVEWSTDSESENKIPKRPSLNESIYGAERVMLIPKLEKLLGSFGLEGKPCLLRAICEAHEVQPLGIGLVGELLTLFFSISRSAFAGSHLAEYLTAEEFGRHGDCTTYFESCPSSLFYWEKTSMGINEMDLEDEEFELELLRHFL